MTAFPSIFRVRQKWDASHLTDIAGEVHSQLSRLSLKEKVRTGETVAISVGSRGIENIPTIIKATAEHLKSLGATPFIVPSMGSHGGGTAAGQRRIVESYGITEEFCGCPIRSSMDTVVVCEASEGFPVHFDRHAYEADHVVVCNRVKLHTGFTGDIQSGLMKMMLIGLGKHAGAIVYHRAIQDYSFGQIVRSVAREVLTECKILAGLAILENGYNQTARIEAVPPQEFESREKELLQLARQWMPKLPFQSADILILDEIGKNISGTGMDTNVVGRKYDANRATEDEFPKLRRIVVRDIADESHGNATGIGLAEFCRTRVIEKMNVEATRINCITGGDLPAAKIPVHYDTDREVLERALSTIGLTEPPDAKLMWAKNTLEVAEVECSEVYIEEARSRSDLEILTDLRKLDFDGDGNLPVHSENG